MGKLVSKDVLQVRPTRMYVNPVVGWSWYCGYHDTYGIAEDRDECSFMFGAHMHYYQIDGDVCEPYYKEWQVKEEA